MAEDLMEFRFLAEKAHRAKIKRWFRREMPGVRATWKVSKGSCTLLVPFEGDVAQRILNAIRASGVMPVGSLLVTRWTDEEMAAAPWHSLVVARSGHGYLYGRRELPYFEDADACPECGTGTRLPGDRVFIKNAPRMTGDVMRAGRGTLLVSSAFVERAKSAKLTGVAFVPVFRDASGERFDDSWALEAHSTAPKQTVSTDLVHEDGCSCGRESWFDNRLSRRQCAYDEGTLPSTVDVLETWEHLAYGRRPEGRVFLCAVPRLLVSRRFYEAFKDQAKKHRFVYTPVKVVKCGGVTDP